MKAIVVSTMSMVMSVAITAAICAFPVLASSGHAAYAAAPNPSSYASSGYTLTFSDDFNGTSLDTSKWNYRTDSRFDMNWDPIQLASNVSVSGGDLVEPPATIRQRTRSCSSRIDKPKQSNAHNQGLLSVKILRESSLFARMPSSPPDNKY
ncbi:hypothetical protein [Paenibacillus sp. FSL H8-0034]|uniref:hypothetical protein n=1 Tax=Paenibacillus sp. FSL H8-0034 TaxID=2954671 RepID=UPI0030F96CB6